MKLKFFVNLLFIISFNSLVSCKKSNLNPQIAELCPQDGNTIGIIIDDDEKHCLDWSEATRIEDGNLRIFQIKYGKTWEETVRLSLVANRFKGKGKYNVIVKEFTNGWYGKNENFTNKESIPNGTLEISKCEELKDQNYYLLDGGFNLKIKFTNGSIRTINSYFKSLKVQK
jgi:hypothetical protein